MGAEVATIIDAEVVTLDEPAAKRLDTSIRLKVRTIRDNFEQLQEKVFEAKHGEVWRVLGFASWTAYLADVMGGQPLMLQRAERQELTEFLADEGMSVRAISAVTGASKSTVSSDLKSVLSKERAEQAPVRAAQPGVQDRTPAAKKVTGTDGKTYTRPTAVKDRPKGATIPKPVPHAKFLRNLATHSATPLARVLAQFIEELPKGGLDDSIVGEVETQLIEIYAELHTEVRRLERLLCGLGIDG